jgi:sugar/nucleoside kinase (ribokinase family)
MSIVAVGTVAIDSIETPTASVHHVLGGSATYFSFAASLFTQVHLVAVVGEDFPQEHIERFRRRGIDLAGLEVRRGGKTFFWRGRYHADMNNRDTLEVHLNVLADFNPTLPDRYRELPYVFLGNSSPQLQQRVLDQMTKPQMVLADTMNLWIETQRDALLELLPRLDGLLLNDSEARLLAEDENLVRAGLKIRELGPKFVIIKKGEHGSFLFSRDGVFVLPGYPTPNVVDPTGAGDSFAGGILGYLASDTSPPPGRLRRAIAYGTVIASITVEGFSLERLQQATREEIERRLEEYRRMITF